MRVFVALTALIITMAMAGGPVRSGASAPAASSAIAWTVDANPQPTTGNRTLFGVACTSATHCLAVGSDSDALGTLGRPVVLRFDGVQWALMTHGWSPTVSGSLRSIDCLSATDCFAVGAQRPAGHDEMLIEHWDGSTWSIVAAPTLSGASAMQLSDISCADATHCMAVGTFNDAAQLRRALAVQLSNGAWTISSAPSSSYPTRLNSVSCPSFKFCVAGGVYFDDSSFFPIPRPWLLRWNGAKWVGDVVSASPGTIFDVACASRSSCVALDFNVFDQSLIRFWDGSSWTSAFGPQIADRGLQLNAIICGSGTCTAVGESRQRFSMGSAIPVVATLSGRTWAVDQLDVRPSGSLYGVACPVANGCVVVGATTNALELGSAVTSRAVAVRQTFGPTNFSVAVPWTVAEDARLVEMADYVGVSPEQMQHDAVGVLAYLLGIIADPNPIPVVLPPVGTANTRVSLWAHSDETVLASVRAKYVVDDVDAHRFSVGVVSYLLALGGH